MGYSMIQGEPATSKKFTNFDGDEAARKLATQLRTFLTELHAVSVDRAIPETLPSGTTLLLDRNIRPYQGSSLPTHEARARGLVAGLFEVFLTTKPTLTTSRS